MNPKPTRPHPYSRGALLRLACTALAAGGFGSGVHGTSDANSRPQALFQTETVYPQDKGEVQLSSGADFRRSADDAGHWEIPLTAEYGLSDQWQVEIEWSSFLQHRAKSGSSTRGIGDFSVGTQYSFLNIAGTPFHLAVRVSVGVPVGRVARGFSEGFFEYEPSVTIARDLAGIHHVQVFAQLGVSFVQRAREPKDPDDREPAAHEVQGSMGFLIPIARGIASAEISGRNNRWNHAGEENESYLTPGWTWKLSRHGEVGVGVPIGLGRGSDRFGVISRFTCEF